MKKTIVLFMIVSCVFLFSCTDEPAADSGTTPGGGVSSGWDARSGTPVRGEKFEKGPAPPEDATLPGEFRTPEACFRTGVEAVKKGDVLTWRRCHEGRIAALLISACVQRQRALFGKEAKDKSDDELLAMAFKEITGEDGKKMASMAIGKTNWSKDGKNARISVTYAGREDKNEYKFTKTSDGWKIERPCLMPDQKR